MTTEPTYVEATLNWCNERRAEKGMEPLSKLPKGVREDGKSCPCGKATGLIVGLSWYHEEDQEQQYNPNKPLPNEVQEFVMAFDEGALPQYDLYPDERMRSYWEQYDES